jgi:hypothetical protein
MRAVIPLHQWLVWHRPADVAKATWFYTFTYTVIVLATRMSGPIPIRSIYLISLACRWGVNVNCAADAVAPTPPVMQDACGNTLHPVAGVAPSP